ncbi:MAG TPA: O-antigen ligase family protein [Bryobacteraceae bacterium]|jgi:O-antigen ligase|nr:O-antigen ligase family protein [Bryobacteraceae bacterium]
MSSRTAPAVLWATLLWSALLTGILVAWSPRYWAVSAAIGALSAAVVSWTVVSTLRGAGFAWPRQMPLVVLIGVWGFLQVLFKTSAIPGLTMGNSLIWLMSACAFIVGAQILRHRATRQLFLQLLLWSVTALAVIAMIQATSHPVEVFGIFPADDDVMGTFLSQNQFAALMELAAPVALWYMIGRNPLPGGLCYAMLLAATITAGSRMGVVLVGFEALVFVIIVVLTRRLETRKVAGIVAGLAVLFAAAMVIAGTDRVRSHFEEKNPYAIRRQLFDSTVHLVAERPWTGYGIGTWRAEYPHTATFDLALLANEAHNDWLEWAAEGGVFFALLMAGLVVWIAPTALQSIWGLGILCVMVHSYVDYPLREPVLSFLWFTLAGAVASFPK